MEEPFHLGQVRPAWSGVKRVEGPRSRPASCPAAWSQRPLVVYLSGNADFAYVVIAALIWVISRDLERHHPLVRMCGWVMVVAGPAYLSIDLQCPLPWWWTLVDSAGCFLVGLALLWACPSKPKA